MGRKKRAKRFVSILALVAITGCAGQRQQSLTADAFMPKPVPLTADTSAQPPVAQVDDPPKKASVLPPALAASDTIPPLEPLTSPTTAPTDQANVSTTQPAAEQPVAETSAQPPTTAPTGLYMTLGCVVAEVNGTPIYANRILTLLDRQFSVKAREMSPELFRAYARGELRRQRDELIANEAEYAAAQRLLTADDKKLVEQFAMPRFYQQKVTEAGGSVEQAKRKARADGQNFDDMMQQEHRKMMQELFYQRRIIPRIQVSAGDMRDYYRANVDTVYAEHAQAQFRVIKIDPKRIGGPNAKTDALDRIKAIHQKAVNGEDFATLASTENQDDYLKSRGGDPGGWMQRDAYRIDAVDKAIWKLHPGQVTDVIEADDAFYIAKLEARKDGRVRPFEDQAVQDEIRNKLWDQQLRILRDKVRQELVNEAVIRADDSLLDVAVDMAMQKYQQWASR
jgi:parvulin-like peptidyl-prolyl isomerase